MFFHLASNPSDVDGLRSIYGVRAIGLIDSGSQIYGTYRVPNPEAPYPQDHIIDKQGRVMFWEAEYDTQASIKAIEELLAYQPPAGVDVVPDAGSVQPGATLGYTVVLVNNTAQKQTFWVTTIVILPDSTRIWLRGPQMVTLSPWQRIEARFDDPIPLGATPGAYSLKVKVAANTDDVWDVDGFPFRIE